MKKIRAEDQEALDLSLVDAQKCACRLARCLNPEGLDAALVLVLELLRLGAHAPEVK